MEDGAAKNKFVTLEETKDFSGAYEVAGLRGSMSQPLGEGFSVFD